MITTRKVQDAVCKHFDITRDQLLQPGKAHKVCRPRQIAMFLSREMTGDSLQAIGTAFCRDHTTVLCGIRRTGHLQIEPHWRAAITEIQADLNDPESARRRDYEVMMGRLWTASVPRCFAPGAYVDEGTCRSFLERVDA